jgi:DNA-binding YbaB/EbfC family protein
MNQMLRQAQALQRKMDKAREELAAEEVSGSAGGGAVTVAATGTGEITRIDISPEMVDPDDVGMLQDTVTAAVNEALRAAKELEDERMGEIGAGMGLPPGMV